MVTDEVAVAGLVRSKARLLCPSDPHAGDLAVEVALEAFAAGASVSEACREGRAVVECWSRHPCHREPALDAPVALAS